MALAERGATARGKGIVIAAPRSGSGKTVVALGIARALARAGLAVAPAKAGPDYIDPAFLARAAGGPAINLDPWAMAPDRLRGLASCHAQGHDLLLIEGVMGLFDGAADGRGATADLAAALRLPVILVIDCAGMSQSVAALARGFAEFRTDVEVCGVILNRVGSDRHETMLRAALRDAGVACMGALPRRSDLDLPSRHLGLVLPGEVENAEETIARAGAVVETHLDLRLLTAMAGGVAHASRGRSLPPLGQRVAIAHDTAFAFVYPHMLEDWHRAGATLSFFSPLADQSPAADADAVFLPGGYPELHGAALAQARAFRQGLEAARARRALIYGECGGFMVLGTALTDAQGVTHPMTGLLPVESRIDRPRRVLGYRRLGHGAPLPWPARLVGHEFHYSRAGKTDLPPLFAATDALDAELPAMGAVLGTVMGSYAHVIDPEPLQ